MASKYKWVNMNGTLNEDRLQGSAIQLTFGAITDISWPIKYNLLAFLSPTVKKEAYQLFDLFGYWRKCILYLEFC